MNTTQEALRTRLKQAICIIGAKSIRSAEKLYKLDAGTRIQCGFCGVDVYVAYAEVQLEGSDYFVPEGFVYLPEGMFEGDDPCHISYDAFRVNMGLQDAELEDILHMVEIATGLQEVSIEVPWGMRIRKCMLSALGSILRASGLSVRIGLSDEEAPRPKPLAVALEDSILTWCALNLPQAGSENEIKQAVQKQVEQYAPSEA